MPLPRPADLPSPTPEGSSAPIASAARSYECDGCGRSFDGVPDGSGLFVWTRGEETRYEEPPLCGECAQRITMGALLKWSLEEEEEG
jgi:hypothetical protein